jgi:adenylate cyclase
MLTEITTLLLQAKKENESNNYLESLHILSSITSIVETIKEVTDNVIQIKVETLILTSKNYFYLQQTDESITNALNAIKLLESFPNKQLLSIAYSIMGSNLYNIGDFQQSLEYVQNTLSIREELNDKVGCSQSFYIQGNIYNVTGNYQKAFESYQQSLQLKEDLADYQGIVSNYIAIGLVHKELSKFTKALEYYSKSIEISTQHNFTLSIANAKTNIGSIHHVLGDFSTSLEYYLEAIPLFEEVSNDLGISNCYNNIGLVYSIIGEYDKSIEFNLKSLNIKEKIQNNHGIAASLNNLGSIYLQLNDFEKALEYYKSSLLIRKEIKDKKGIASTLTNLGGLHIQCSKYEEGFECLIESLKIIEQLNDTVGNVTTLIKLGSLYSNKKFEFISLSKAEEYLRMAESKARSISYKVGLINVYQALSQMYETFEMFKEALENHKKSIILEKEYFEELAIESTRKFEHRLQIEESLRERKVMETRLQEQERLLFDILPSNIATKIMKGEKTISEHNQNVCILFTDIVGFTETSQSISSDELVQNLNRVFLEFDRIAKKHSIEKIKTIGDSYMAISGINIQEEHPSYAIAKFALELLQATQTMEFGAKKLSVRIGIHIGDIVSGVIGGHKYSYDIWGDAVNIASRMESYSLPGKIHITQEFADSIISYTEFTILPRGEVTIKGKGIMNTFWLEKA